MSACDTSASQKITRRFTITGRVQGVFFRDSTRRVAKSLALVGHAINKSDGSVEVLACGDRDALASLEKWLHDGPPMASVTAVIDHGPDDNKELCGDGFRIG